MQEDVVSIPGGQMMILHAVQLSQKIKKKKKKTESFVFATCNPKVQTHTWDIFTAFIFALFF